MRKLIINLKWKFNSVNKKKLKLIIKNEFYSLKKWYHQIIIINKNIKKKKILISH